MYEPLNFRAKDPGCPFVKNPEASGNVSVENEENYKQESGRLATFNNWPVPFIVKPEDLAKTGFYYLRQGDKVSLEFISTYISVRVDIFVNFTLEVYFFLST